jgi:hypothetical protein
MKDKRKLITAVGQVIKMEGLQNLRISKVASTLMSTEVTQFVTGLSWRLFILLVNF